MKNGKIKALLKTKKASCILTGVITFFITCGLVSDSGTVLDLKDEVAELKTQLTQKEEQIVLLQNKVNEAKPFFEMQDEEKKKLEEDNKKAQEEKKKAELEANSIELGNGNFVAGEDFKAGTYNIIAVSGKGNVISDNMFNGGINAIMSPTPDEMSESEYKNIKLPKGTTLKLRGVTVKLVPKA